MGEMRFFFHSSFLFQFGSLPHLYVLLTSLGIGGASVLFLILDRPSEEALLPSASLSVQKALTLSGPLEH